MTTTKTTRQTTEIINVALDIGNYATKVLDSKNKTVRYIRSVKAEVIPGQRLHPGSLDSPIISTDSRIVHLGHGANRYPLTQDIATGNKLDPDNLLDAAYAALAPIKGKNAYTVNLAVSTPRCDRNLGDKTASEILTEALKGKHCYIYNLETDMSVTVKTVKVLSETQAVWLTAKAQGQIPDTGYTLLVDFGGGTVNAELFDETGYPVASYSNEKAGGIGLAALIAGNLKFQNAIDDISLATIQDGIADGSYNYAETGFNYRDILESVKGVWFKQALQSATTSFRPYAKNLRAILVSGGNANLVADKVASIPGCDIVESPREAVVRGLMASLGS